MIETFEFKDVPYSEWTKEISAKFRIHVRTRMRNVLTAGHGPEVLLYILRLCRWQEAIPYDLEDDEKVYRLTLQNLAKTILGDMGIDNTANEKGLLEAMIGLNPQAADTRMRRIKEGE